MGKQPRKHVIADPIEWPRSGRSPSSSGLRNNRRIHGALLVCRTVHPTLADSFRQQTVRHYPRGMRAAQHHPMPEKGAQLGTGHEAAIAAT